MAVHNNSISPTFEGFPKFNIVVVDDSPLNQKILSKLLSTLNQEVTTFSSGEDALTHLQSVAELPRLVISDFNMKQDHMNGFEFISALRKIERLAPLHCILWTDDQAAKEGHDWVELKVTQFLAKPAKVIDVGQAIAKFIELNSLAVSRSSDTSPEVDEDSSDGERLNAS